MKTVTVEACCYRGPQQHELLMNYLAMLTENQSTRDEIPLKLALALPESHCDAVNRFVITVV